ncbi:MAG: glycosyltransferase family 4 protein [Herpetosiphon sp.]
MRRLRIAFVDSWLTGPATGSGTAVAIGGLGSALAELGHLVDRIAPTPGRGPFTLRRLGFNLAARHRLLQTSYDLVVGFDFDGYGFALCPNHAYVCSVKGVIAEELRFETGRVKLLFRLLAYLEGWNARRGDAVIATSMYCRQTIHEHYRVPLASIGVVSEGIDLERWRSALHYVAPRSDMRPTILCVARQYSRKRIGDLIRVVPSLLKYQPDLQVHIVGDGPLHNVLVDLAGHCKVAAAVQFLTDLSFQELIREYAYADVFCLPSAQEGFGIVFLEAMAASLPIVSTRAAAIPEVVVHGDTGILVAPGDVSSLAGALLFLLNDGDVRSRYSQAAQRRVEAFDWRMCAERFLALVEPLV